MRKPISDADLVSCINSFINDREHNLHRYASFDFCHNYFFTHRHNLTGNKMQESCCQLWGFLSSWGMLRGSSSLLQYSMACLKPLIEHLDNTDTPLWNIDADRYNPDNISLILNEYSKIKKILKTIGFSPTITLVTKIMLGVYAAIPAYDKYFTQTFKELYNDKDPKCKFASFNEQSLRSIADFYESHKHVINDFHQKIKILDFNDKELNLTYSKAKIIDMFGFVYGHQLPQKEK